MLNRIVKLAGVLMFLLALFLPGALYADSVIGTMGRQNSSGTYAVEVTTDGSTQSVNYDPDTAIKMPYQAGTTNDTLTAADSGKTIVTKSGVVSPVIFKLPDATVQLNYTFVGGTAHAMYIDPATGDTINYASLSTNDSLTNSSAAKGDSVTFFCAVADQWEVIIHSGTWADGNSYGL